MPQMICRHVRPLISITREEARIRVLGLYKAWCRYLPHLETGARYYDMPKTENDCRWKLREYFYKNCHVDDIRVIDLLVLKGHMELEEVSKHWQQKGYMLSHWNPTAEPKPVEFLDKFYAGPD